MSPSLDLALVGNGRIGLLIDGRARIVWGCFPRFDGDPVFCALLDAAAAGDERGIYAIELVDAVRHEQSYDPNTAVLTTRAHDRNGAAIEVVDCVPRFVQHDRLFQPMVLVRRIRALAGCPRVVVRLRPAYRYGALLATATVGSSHIRYVGPDLTLRLTTDASLTAITEERPFVVDREMTLLFGPDETLTDGLADVGRRFIEQTRAYWRDWVRRLAIPFEWQGAVIRAALTLQQNAFDDTGGIVAAMTTSIPEAPDSGRNWDYRHCWLRDAYFVVDALNRLNTTATMERYLGYLVNVTTEAADRPLQPVYGINGDAALVGGRSSPACPGIAAWGRCATATTRSARSSTTSTARRFSPSATSSSTGAWRIAGTRLLFARLEPLAGARRCSSTSPTPDCGSSGVGLRVHTFSSVMCWAACDRLARIARHLGLAGGSRPGTAMRRTGATLRRVALLERERRRALSQRSTATRWMRVCCLLADVGLRASGRSPFRRNRRGGRPRTAARRLRLPLRRRR